MDGIKVSIIIPAYNCEKTIKRSIDSALIQSLSDIEVIVIDDGSTDDTKKVCEQYLTDLRFKYHYKKNGGVSTARNMGISLAQGEYIGFIDSDDTVAPDMYEKMYSACKKEDADICVCDINRCKPNGDIVKDSDDIDGGVYHRDDIEKTIMRKCLGYVDDKGKIVRIDWCVLRRLFKREFLSNNDILFDESLSNSEDCLFVYTATINAYTIIYLKEEYLYNNIISGVSLTRHYLPTYWEQRCQIIDTVYRIAREKGVTLNEDMMKLFIYRCMWASYNNIAIGFSQNTGIHSYKEFKCIVKHHYVRQAVGELPDLQFDFEWNRIIQWTKKKKSFTLYSYYKDTYGHSRFYHRLRKITKRISR